MSIAEEIHPRLPLAETEPYSRLIGWLPAVGALVLPLGVLAFFVHPKLGALALGALVAPVVLLSPEHGLLLLVAALPTDAVSSLGPPGTATVTRLLGLAVTVGWALNVLLRRQRIVIGRAGHLLLAYIAYSALSILWAPDYAVAFRSLWLLVQLFVLYVMVVNLLPSREAIQRALDVLLASTVVVALFVFWQLPRFQGTRATLQLGEEMFNPNKLAATLILPVFVALAAGRGSSRWWRAFAVVPLIVASLVTGARGATLALLAGGLVLVALRPRLLPRIVAAGGAVALAALVLVPQDRLEMLSERYASMAEDRGSGRLDIWRVGGRMIVDRPVTGVGLAGFQPEFYDYMGAVQVDPYWAREWRNRYGLRGAHNVYLKAFAELGVIGLALLLAALAAHALALWREYRHAHAERRSGAAGLCLALLCILTVLLALFTNNDLLTTKSAWVVLGMVQAGVLTSSTARLMRQRRASALSLEAQRRLHA